MSSEEEKGQVTVDFHHPYTPYTIQEDFMRTVYQVLEQGKVGILESPTGTGKSLSLICGSLTWLRDHKKKTFEEGLNWTQDDAEEPDWVIEQAKARKRRDLIRQREDMEARLAKTRAKEKAQRDRFSKGDRGHKKRKLDLGAVGTDGLDEADFALDDYDSDQEVAAKFRKDESGEGLSADTLALMDKLGMMVKPRHDEEAEEDEIKIFFCSRTHSQLTQFINELRRVKMPPSLQQEAVDPKQDTAIHTEDFKHLTLGSRKNLCINTKVNTPGRSATSINERCMELQQSGSSAEHKCGFLPNRENQPLVNDFRDHNLATIRDIEELGTLGKQIGICPYYASRSAIKPSEIVTLPYPLLLQKSAREALGISLKNHVVIIDEAHNLMDAIAGIYGISVTLTQLKKARGGLGTYLQKFKNKLKGKNRVYVAQVVRLLDSLATYLEAKMGRKQAEGAVDPTELLAGKGVDQINLYKLLHYLQESKLARKVEGYLVHAEQEQALTAPKPSKDASKKPSEATTPVLQHIQGLLAALTNPGAEGRLFHARTEDGTDIALKYLLLDPTHHFRDIVSEARAVVLAGGTMAPMSDYTQHLFSYLPESQITTLSCGHVIPKENLIAWPVGKGPTGIDLEFTFEKRGTDALIDELGRTILNLCIVIPDGVVVFFPSYAYLDTVITRWQKSPVADQKSVWERLASRKQVFQESKASASVEEVLQEYAMAIDTGKGSLLLSVVGGKMSEGINFSDRLGRGVIIVGLPFPNIHSAEWKAKIEFIETATYNRLATGKTAGGEGGWTAAAKGAGREFYENACMRAVNQSVGRAIRHRGDFAAIVMLDRRFGSERIRGKLPGWIQEGLMKEAEKKGFGELMGALGGFFRGKRGV